MKKIIVYNREFFFFWQGVFLHEIDTFVLVVINLPNTKAAIKLNHANVDTILFNDDFFFPLYSNLTLA